MFAYCFMRGGALSLILLHMAATKQEHSLICFSNSVPFMQLLRTWHRSNLFQCTAPDCEDVGTRWKMKTDSVCLSMTDPARGLQQHCTEREKTTYVNNMCNKNSMHCMDVLFYSIQ